MNGKMKSRIVIADYRYNSNSRKKWKTLIEFDIKEIKPLSIIPEELKETWRNRKKRKEFVEVYGYLHFNGLTPELALKIVALAKAGKALINVNRWSEIAFWSLKNNKDIDKD